MSESPKVILLEDSNTKERLERKLQEYKVRVHRYPTNLYVITDSKYKIAIIERLLEKGKVDTWNLSRELKKKDRHLDVAAFEKACFVIKDYCTTGGRHVWGGTGF